MLDTGYIINKVKEVFTNPKGCWAIFKAQPESIEDLYKRYLIPLVIVNIICGFIGNVFVGTRIPVVGITYHTPFISGLWIWTITGAFMLAVPYIAAAILEALAPKFNGSISRTDAFKLVVYSLTPGLVAGILNVVPGLAGVMFLISLYGFYLLWEGVKEMASVPQDQRLVYVIASVVTVAVANFVIFSIISWALFPRAAIG